MRNRMIRRKHYVIAERELMQGLSASLRRKHPGSDVGECPSPKELRQLAAGNCDSLQRDRLLAHLAACDRCIDSMSGLRRRRWMLRTAFAVASVTLVIGVAVWLWAIQHRVLPDVNRVAVVDLRLISPTRGEIPGPGAATVLKAAGGLRVILPVGSDGNYESEIIRADTRPILRSSGTTRVEGGEVVLNLRIDLSTLNSGRYLLALRRDGSEWEYYSLTVE